MEKIRKILGEREETTQLEQTLMGLELLAASETSNIRIDLRIARACLLYWIVFKLDRCHT